MYPTLPMHYPTVTAVYHTTVMPSAPMSDCQSYTVTTIYYVSFSTPNTQSVVKLGFIVPLFNTCECESVNRNRLFYSTVQCLWNLLWVWQTYSLVSDLWLSNVTTACVPVVSINKVPRIVSPVLVIHGTEDEVIDFTHGLAIYERCPRALAPLWIEGAGHNDIELYSQYLDRLKRLVNVDLTPKCPQTDLLWLTDTAILQWLFLQGPSYKKFTWTLVSPSTSTFYRRLYSVL